MPYGGTTKSQDKKIERCVAAKIADSKFKPQKGRTKKESAIAVCKSAIIRSKEFSKQLK